MNIFSGPIDCEFASSLTVGTSEPYVGEKKRSTFIKHCVVVITA